MQDSIFRFQRRLESPVPNQALSFPRRREPPFNQNIIPDYLNPAGAHVSLVLTNYLWNERHAPNSSAMVIFTLIHCLKISNIFTHYVRIVHKLWPKHKISVNVFFRLSWCGRHRPSQSNNFNSIRCSGGILFLFCCRKRKENNYELRI